MDIALLGILLLFLIICSGFFSASETALFSLPATKIKAYQNSKDSRRKLIAKLVSEPRDLLVTVFMLNTLVNILIQNTASDMVGQYASWLLKVGLPFVLMFFLGEIIPKYIGLKNNVKLADDMIVPIDILQNILSPIRKIIVKVTVPISRVLFFFLKKEESISKEELNHVLKTSEERGVLDPSEAELIRGYLNFRDTSVRELMRPKEDIIFFDINEPLSKLIYLFTEQECSRMPVCDHSMDKVLGMITAKQFFLNRQKITTSHDLVKYLVKPLYVPENISATALRIQFEVHKQVIALVVDEYGSICGLITHEDLVEEVIGEIADLRDTKSLYTKAGSNGMIASGRLELDDFNEFFQTNLSSKNNVTIGGWLSEEIQEIPQSGSKYNLQGFHFKVLSAGPNRIYRLYISRLEPQQLEKEDDA